MFPHSRDPAPLNASDRAKPASRPIARLLGSFVGAFALCALAAPAAAQPAAQPAPKQQPPAKKAAPDPDSDTKATTKGPNVATEKAPEVLTPFDKVFTTDWFSTARPSLEIHGYFRVRSELFFNFDLGRHDDPSGALWPRPASDQYDFEGDNGQLTTNTVQLCGDPLNPEPCKSFTQGSANMRLRFAPVLTISDNIRAFSQIDLFDNILLGSTPEGYVNQPAGDPDGGYEVRQPGGYTPIGAFGATQWAPTAGQNSLSDSIKVKRAWGEYISPIGTFRFGRMPNHWGLGMVYNAGDGMDQDYGSTVDRIMFQTGIPKFELYFAGMWDWADEGAVGGPFYGCKSAQDDEGNEIGCSDIDSQRYQREAKRYDLSQSDDVYQWGLAVYRKRDPGREKLDLAQGNVVVNGGAYGMYRNQFLESRAPIGANPSEVRDSLTRRGYEAFIPDLWGELKWKKLRVGMEAALVWGSIENTVVQNGNNFDNPDTAGDEDDGWNLQQFGFVVESDFRTVEDRLKISFDFGFATGDADVEGINGFGPGGLSASEAPLGGLDAQLTRNRTYSSFRFHPDYQIDQILWRRIIGRVQSAYYFKPGITYDILRSYDGQRAGGGLDLVWSRATAPVQAPGNAPDLGVELDAKIYYQGLGGTYDPEGRPLTGFYGQLDYAVLFPLPGLGYLPGDKERLGEELTSTSIAHMLRLYLGMLF